MRHRQAIRLAREIAALYQRTCELSTRFNENVAAECRPLRDAFRARPQTLVPELEYFETIFDRQEAIQRALAEPWTQRKVSAFFAVCYLATTIVMWHALSGGGSMLIAGALAALMLATGALRINA